MAADDPRSTYRNPLVERYASREMAAIFSDRRKFSTWRRIWLALAESQAELGLSITPAQLDAMRAHLDDIDFEAAEKEERRRRHDVMAHVHAFGLAAPAARPILHLGATSADIGDNADLVIQRDALRLLVRRVVDVLGALGAFAARQRDLACLGSTHLQPAQPTTVGKRACLWAHDLLLDLGALQQLADDLPLRGIKGTTGTQASFLDLFDGSHDKVRRLEEAVARRLGFAACLPVTGQTYARKLDTRMLSAVAGIGESAGKLSSDVRILQAFGEMAEPFEADQTGSSAMAYKRNPMRCERAASLSRFLTGLPAMAAQTASTQWLERTLDDSAIRRIVIPEAFLAADAILVLLQDVVQGLEVFPKVVARRLRDELPFMATEALLMEGVKAGGDRQDLHEAIRRHAHEAARRMREEGATNDLFDRLGDDPHFASVRHLLPELRDPARFVGRAPEQVDELLAGTLRPAVEAAKRRLLAWGTLGGDAAVRV
jgi:adenylosuccinate lyase